MHGHLAGGVVHDIISRDHVRASFWPAQGLGQTRLKKINHCYGLLGTVTCAALDEGSTLNMVGKFVLEFCY